MEVRGSGAFTDLELDRNLIDTVITTFTSRTITEELHQGRWVQS